MKKIIPIITLAAAFTAGGAAVSAQEEIRLELNGIQVAFDVSPKVINGRTMVPLRGIFEVLGAEVAWNGEAQYITAVNDDVTVEAQVGVNNMLINGADKAIDAAPMIVGGRALVPVRFVAEAFNCDVSWDANTKTVSLTAPGGISAERTNSSILLTPENTAVPAGYIPMISCNYYQQPGDCTISWKDAGCDVVYTVAVKEQRNCRYEGDIGPDEIDYYHVWGKNSLSFIVHPDKTYTITVSAGDVSDTTSFVTGYIENPDKDSISGSYPTTQEEAEALMTEIEIPVWKIGSSGEKYASTARLEVHPAIAQKVVNVFTQIFNGPEKFPIYDVGAYSWRGSRSEHNGGTAIDINPDENYCIYNNGTTIGSYWKPYEDPYSITPYGDVVEAFEEYGFTWGGDSWSNPKDYMHFSYLGT